MMIPMTREELENATREEIIHAYVERLGDARQQAESMAALLLGEVTVDFAVD